MTEKIDMTVLEMPKLSEDMTEGTISHWLVPDGSNVKAGEEIVDVETGKSSVALAAPANGILRVVAEEGSVIEVDGLIAEIASEDLAGAGAGHSAPEPSESHAVPFDRQARGADPLEGERSNGIGVKQEAEGTAFGVAPRRVTPLARRLADRHGIPIDTLTPTAVHGRITAPDVAIAAGLPWPDHRHHARWKIERSRLLDQPPNPETASRDEPSAKGSEPLTTMQRVVAQRMTEAKQTIPHFQVQVEVDVDALLRFRSELRAQVGESAPSINDLIIKAAALTLREHPIVNGTYTDGGFVLHERIDIGVAVASEDALSVVTVRNADTSSLGVISREVNRLVAGVKDGTIVPDDLTGSTFTVSNLGMYGMSAIYPVINAPQAAILGVGAGRKRLRLDEEGRPFEVTEMTLTLSCDHRILYGAQAARFLRDLADRLTSPMGLAL